MEFLSIFVISLVTGLFLFYKLKYDELVGALRRRKTKSVILDWQKKLPQRLPNYTYPLSKKIEDTGIIAQDSEYETERPSPTSHKADQICLYGSDSEGNFLVAKATKLLGGLTEVQLSVRVNKLLYTVTVEGVSKSNHDFSLGNFKLEMVEPFRVWRVWYNGIMKEEESGILSHGVINFLWKPLDRPFDNMKDASIDLLAHELMKGNAHSLDELKSMLTLGYSQFGTLHGTVKISCKVDSTNFTMINFDETLHLCGFRDKRFLSIHRNHTDSNQEESRVELFGFCDSTGIAFRLKEYNGAWIDSQIYFPGRKMIPVYSVDSLTEKSLIFHDLPTVISIKGPTSLHVEVLSELKNSNTNSVKQSYLTLNIDGKPSHGVLIRNSDEHFVIGSEFGQSESLKLSTVSPEEIQNTSSNPNDIIGFASDECTQIHLVGGKGGSLARIAHFGLQNTSKFKTARGFCVTTKMFRRTIDLSQITKVFKTSICNDDSSLEKACSRAKEVIRSSSALNELREILPKFLESTFGQEKISVRYAVRSSGVLEDGSELSCAGQNETFLGVEENSIAEKVIDCWCSLFTSQSVKYRLNHGQLAVSEIAVVVQEMVDASCAGVMFTADPRTGNPFEMLVTANFGLGESVVSASCDPDSFTLRRMPDILTKKNYPYSNCWKTNITSRTLGDKKSKIIMSGSATKEMQMSEEDSSKFSVSDSTLLELGNIGIQLESQLGEMKPVDIEWAVTKNGEIYILQSRPITSLNAWTDFEITHEFDSALRSSVELFTRANTGEVSPNVIFPLGVQGSMRLIDFSVQESQSRMSGHKICPFTMRNLPIFGQKLFLDAIGTLYAKADDNPNAPSIACGDLSVFERPMMTKEIHDIVKFRYGHNSKLDTLKGIKMVYDIVSKSKPLIETADKTYKDMQLDYTMLEQTPECVYAQISRDFEHMLDITSVHMAMSSASSTTLLLAFMFLTEQKEVKDWSPSLYEDAGTILSAYSAVESAEIPIDITRLGKTIVEHGVEPEQFLAISKSQDALEWLRSNNVVKEALGEFLKKHGHRSVAEMDLGQTSWKADPSPLVNLLKNTVRGQLELKNNPTSSQAVPRPIFENDDDLLSSLRTPLKSGTKRFLKFILPYCRRSVAFREKSKSLTVRIFSLVKDGYYLLGELMTREQLIPSSQLVPHLTHHELGLLIKQDPSATSILYKAMRRSKLYSVLSSRQYPEMCVGFPEPIDNAEDVEITDVIRGTPVSSGIVKGIAKVCRSVEEASELIHPGDILITVGTDVAWSPFFPIIGGVVTELGGLISHGAVVAREYGLPCIVGAVNSTRIFQSGDEVVLDTSTGTLSKVKSTDK